MTEHSTEFTQTEEAAYAASLLRHYSFELSGHTPEHLLSVWMQTCAAEWVRLAVIEALYQGRYKAISVEQILLFWQRRGQPLYHFNREFERLVSNKLPRTLVPRSTPVPGYSPTFSQTHDRPHTNHFRPDRADIHPLDNHLDSHSAVYPTKPANSERSLNLLQFRRPDPTAIVPTPTVPPLESRALQFPAPLSSTSDLQSPESNGVGTPCLSSPDFSPNPTAESEISKSGISESEVFDRNGVTESEAGATDGQLVSRGSRFEAALSRIEGAIESIQPKLVAKPTDSELSSPRVSPGEALSSSPPSPKSSSGTIYRPRWQPAIDGNEAIHQFIPTSEAPEFHSKLKSVAEPDESEI